MTGLGVFVALAWPIWAQRAAAPLASAAKPGAVAPALPPAPLPPALFPLRGETGRPLRMFALPSLNALFDGAKPGAEPPPWYHPSGVKTQATQAERLVAQLAKPWRTRAQLQRLAQEPPPPGPVRFQVVGDAEPGRFFFSRWLFNVPGVFERQLAAAQARGGDFVIQLGDMVSRGVALQYRGLLGLLERVGAARPYLTVLGNHDRRSPHGASDSRLYQALFGPPSYWFERGNVRFVVVDSSAGRMTPLQLRWLDRALDTERTKIVFTHMPPIQLRAWTGGVAGFAVGAREFAELVERRGVSRVYVGHVHALDTVVHRGVRYVLSGGGGSPLFPSAVKRRFHHTLEVEVDGAQVRETVHPLLGRPFAL
ncbi:MAG: metallophosphoesterase [Elusimicrobia bacterium]|nr:metallophosphoesterase [Elusimicrobiota bacterium]